MLNTPLDKQIWRIAGPAILGNISIPLLGLVDASLLGHLPEAEHLAGVAVGGAALSFFYWGFSFLRMGTTGEVARALGSGSSVVAGAALARASALALLVGVVVRVLRDFVAALGVIAMGPDPSVSPLALRYMELRLGGAPAVLLTYAIVGWFIGNQNTRWPLLILAGTNIVNIALDAVFILGLNMASEGAALATVIAEYVGLVLALTGLDSKTRRRLLGRTGHQRVPGAYRKLLRSNIELMVRVEDEGLAIRLRELVDHLEEASVEVDEKRYRENSTFLHRLLWRIFHWISLLDYSAGKAAST